MGEGYVNGHDTLFLKCLLIFSPYSLSFFIVSKFKKLAGQISCIVAKVFEKRVFEKNWRFISDALEEVIFKDKPFTSFVIISSFAPYVRRFIGFSSWSIRDKGTNIWPDTE
jgi:hypothetical protein